MDRKIWLSALAAPLMALGASQALAAPQSLGLIASADPVTMQCDRLECSVEFTAYCLERRRKSPDLGTAYYIHNPDSVTVEGVRADGTTIALDSNDTLYIETARGHSAVRMSMPAAKLQTFDIASVRIRVSENATLISVPVAGDTNPNSEADIMIATGPLRAAARYAVDSNAPTIEAARITSRLINTLPRGGRADEVQRVATWEGVSPAPQSPGYSLARESFESCATRTASGSQTLRQCLGSKHDMFIGQLNTRYWNTLEMGS